MNRYLTITSAADNRMQLLDPETDILTTAAAGAAASGAATAANQTALEIERLYEVMGSDNGGGSGAGTPGAGMPGTDVPGTTANSFDAWPSNPFGTLVESIVGSPPRNVMQRGATAVREPPEDPRGAGSANTTPRETQPSYEYLESLKPGKTFTDYLPYIAAGGATLLVLWLIFKH